MDESVTVEDKDSMNKTLKGKITLIADYVPQLEINNTLTEWGKTDAIKIHGYSSYHKIVAYSVSKEEGQYNWEKIEEKKEIKEEKEVKESGKYYVSIKDEVGGITTKEITIDKIDDVLPEIIEINIDKTWGTRKEIKVLAIDKESGIVAYQITKSFEPEKEWNEIEATTEEQTFTKEISENGKWYIHIKDKVGNVKTDSINVDNIDDEGPQISIENNYNDIWTKDNAEVVLNIVEDGSGIDYCEESTDDNEYTRIEQEITDNKLTLTYTGNHNETRYYRCYDEVGNESNKENTTLKIDQTLPTIEKVEKDENGYTNGKVTVTITAHDDIELDANPYTFDGEVWEESNEKEYQKNDENIIIKVKDHVGNVATYEGEIKVDNIDIEGPVISINNPNNNTWTKEDVNVILNINEEGSGIDYCEESTDDEQYTRINKEIIDNTITLKYNEDKNEVRYFKCYDKVGNESNKKFTTLKIDKTNPTIESVTKDIDTMTNQSVTITIKASDDVELDSKPYSFDGGESWIEENYKEYQYNDTNISIQVKDHVGNITIYDKEIKVENIDKQGPTITKVEKIPEEEWTNESVTIKVTASDDVKLASEAYSFDDGLHYQESNEMTYENNKSGIKIKVKDDVGNETSYDEEVNITNIDHTEPSISGVSKSESNWTSGSVTLTINGAEDLGGSGLHDKDRYSFDGGVNWQLGNTKEYLANENNIVIKVQDNAGNIYTYEEVQSITNIDTDGPDIKSMNVSSEWEQTNEISATVIDKDSGIAGYEYSTSETINEGNLTKQDNLTEEQTYKKSVDVNTKWYIYVKDQVGNVSSRNITVEKVDKDAPTIEVVNEKTGWTNEDVTVKINISNISSGSAFDYCEESTNDNDYTKMSETLSDNTISKTYTGNHNETRYYRCFDKAKNRSLTKSTTLKIDQSLPSISGVSKSESNWTSGSVTLTINGAEDLGGSGLHDKERYSFDGGVNWQLENTKEYKANESNIVIKVQDNAGNIYEYPTKQEITNIENELPSITGVKKSPDSWTNGTVTLTIEGASDSGGSGLHDTAAYSFNNGTDWQASASKEYLSNESDIVIKVRDNAGNIYTYQTVQSITNIEKEPPSMTGVSKSTDGWTNGSVTLTIEGATDSGGSGLHDSKRYSFNNGVDWQESATKEYSANENNIIIKVRDNAGNIYTYPTKQEITNIEKEPPSITRVSKSTDGWINGSVTLTIEGAADTGGSGLHDTNRYSFDGGTSWQLENTKEYQVNEENIIIKVQDNAGNIYTYPISQNITNIDKDDPEVSFIAKVEENKIIIDASASKDAGSDIAYYEYKIDKQPYQKNDGSTYTFNDKADGSYIVYVKVTDNVGNSKEISKKVNVAYETVYVSKDGNDETGDGSRNNPILTVEKGYKQVKNEGQIILLTDITSEPLSLNIANKKEIITSDGENKYTIIANNGFITNESNNDITLKNIIVKTNSLKSNLLLNNCGILNINNTDIISESSGDYDFQYLIFNNGKLNINGGTITSSKSSTIYVSNTGSLNMTAGTVSSDGSSAINNSGISTISGGKISSESGNAIINQASSTLTISGLVNVSGSDTAGYPTIYTYGNLNINGGTILASKTSTVYVNDSGSLNMTSGNVTNVDGVALFNSGTSTISGGNISSVNNNSINNRENSTLTINGTANISTADSNTQFPTVYTYGTLNINGGNISAENITAVYVTDTGSLNMTSGSITSNSAHALYNFGSAYMNGGEMNSSTGAAVNNDQKAIIEITNGTIKSEDGVGVSNSGTLTISGGYISSNKNAIINRSEATITGTANVSGSCDTTSYPAILTYGTLNINGGTSSASKTPTVYVADTGSLNMTNGFINNTEQYGLYNLGEANISGGNISSSTNAAVYVGTSGSLEMKNGTVKSESLVAFYNKGNSTIGGGSISSENSNAISNQASSTLTINGTANISVGDNNTKYPAIYTYGTLNINGGNIMAANTITVNVSSTGSLNMTDGTITSDVSYAVYVAGTSTINGGTIKSSNGISVGNVNNTTINGGTIKSEVGTAISSSGTITIDKTADITTNGSNSIIAITAGTLNIYGGNIYGDASVLVSTFENTTLNMTGGKISSFSDQKIPLVIRGKASISGGGISASNSNALYCYTNSNVNITGNTIIENSSSNYPTVVKNASTAVITIADSVTVRNNIGGPKFNF